MLQAYDKQNARSRTVNAAARRTSFPSRGASARVQRGIRYRRGISVAEMLIAVVIMGIGLLITSSMFPIAWYKARDIAEATMLQSSTDAAVLNVKMLCDVFGDPVNTANIARLDSSFVPGEWMVRLSGTATAQTSPELHPDTRVHCLNTGNYAFGTVSGTSTMLAQEQNPLEPSDPRLVQVGDNPWRLEDALANSIGGGGSLNAVAQFAFNNQLLEPRIFAHARFIPALEKIQVDANGVVEESWRKDLELRRYLWAVFYRFNDMNGPASDDGSVWKLAQTDVSYVDDVIRDIRAGLSRTRELTLYVYTLKRPAGARYAQQQGFNPSNGNWGTGSGNPVLTPAALPADSDRLLPSPWRIGATILNMPIAGNPPTGLPTEIVSDNQVVMRMLQEGTHLLDDRTGQLFKVTSRREVSGGDGVVCTLDGFYAAEDILDAPEYIDNATASEAEEMWRNWWECAKGGSGCETEDEPAQRYYWVFPPPVDRTASQDQAFFDGSPPVVGVEIRTVRLAPEYFEPRP